MVKNEETSYSPKHKTQKKYRHIVTSHAVQEQMLIPTTKIGDLKKNKKKTCFI